MGKSRQPPRANRSSLTPGPFVQFERQLLGARVEAWKQYYIDYSGLRSVLERLFAGVDVPVPVHTRQRLRSQFEQVTQRRHTLIVDATRSARSASALYQPVPASRLPIDLTTVVEMGDVESSSILHSAAQSPALSRSSSPPIEAETTPNSSVSRTPQPLLRALTTLPRPSDYDEPSELVEAREEFFAALNEEVAKIDFFYRREESRAAAALDALNTQTLNTDDEVTGNAMRVIKDSWVNLFRRLVMLQNFAKLNQIGFVEILGEFERMTHTYWPDAEEFLHDLATNVHFTTSQVMDELIDRTITTYADAFFGGDTSAARIRLLAKMTKTQRNRNEYMQLGLKMGTCMSLIVWCVVALSTQADELSGQGGMVPVFRGFFLCIVELYLYAWSTFIWHKHRINFVFMLQLSPTTRLSTLDVLDQATGMLLVFCISTLMFAYSVGFGVGVPSLVFPFVIFIFFTAKLFMPFMSVWQTRRVLLDSIFQTLISPFGRVGFREAFVADIVSSMSRVLIDIYYSSCFFVTGVWISDQASDNACQSTTNVAVPILATLPLYWRLAQNLRRWYDTRQAWPHAANAAKFGYTLALVVMGSFQSVVEVARDDAWSPLKAAWMFMFVSSTLLSWLWDVIVDWGLFRKGGSWLLRPVLLFRRSWYYAAIVVDFFLRFCWSVSILPFAFIVVSGKYRESVILPVIYSLELARRFVWSIIRVENEQLHNPERFRPQTFVPVHFDTAKEHSRREQSYKSNVRTVLEFTFLGVLVVLIALVAAVL